MSIVRDADFTVTTRVPSIEVQDRQLRADIYLTNTHPPTLVYTSPGRLPVGLGS